MARSLFVHGTNVRARTVPDAHASDKPGQRGRIKDIPNHAVCLALVETPLGPASDDTTGILTSVLEKGETLAYLAGDVDCRIMQEYTADAAHWFLCQT